MSGSNEGLALLQTGMDASMLAKRDTTVIDVRTAKDAGGALDLEGELSALHERMQEALDRGATGIALAQPRAVALEGIEVAVLPPLERSLYDAKQMIAAEEYSSALRLLDEILLSEPEEESQVLPTVARRSSDRPGPAERPLTESSSAPSDLPASDVQGVAAGRGWARRNDPCPCGSGKKYKRCHGA